VSEEKCVGRQQERHQGELKRGKAIVHVNLGTVCQRRAALISNFLNLAMELITIKKR